MAVAQMGSDRVLVNDAAGQLCNEPADLRELKHTVDLDACDMQVMVSEGQENGGQKPPSPNVGDERIMNQSKKSKSMQLQTSKSGIQTVSVSAMSEGWPEELLHTLDEDGNGVITWDEIMKSVTKRIHAESQAKRMRRIVIALVVALCLAVVLNSASTIVSLEMTKEARVTNHRLVDPSGQKVHVASADMAVKGDGQLCPLNDDGECSSGVVKTGEARSYAALFDLPLFDRDMLASLRELSVPLGDGQELTLMIVGSMKHKSGESATFYAASGNKVVVNTTSMTAFAVVEGERHVISQPRESLRRLQRLQTQPTGSGAGWGAFALSASSQATTEVSTIPRAGSPKTCKCTSVSLNGAYSAHGMVACENCIDVRRSNDKNSCPKGTKIFSPASHEDWKTFLASAEPLNAPHFIVDVTNPTNGCGGCSSHAMNSGVAQQRAWRTSDGSSWWLRSTTYREPNGDYEANCYLHVNANNGVNSLTFNDARCHYHSKSYYCQLEKGR